MDHATTILLGTAAGIGFLHTILGVDHTLPFVVIGRSQRWSLRKLLCVTGACGIVHVASSVAIGTVGMALGAAVGQLNQIEAQRGGLAARLLIGLGLMYLLWGLFRSIRGKRHAHLHTHPDGTVHRHSHDHLGDHSHVHARTSEKTLTILGLMVVFVLGPCEALIPLLMVPAVANGWFTVALVVAVFTAATLLTMLGIVTLGYYGSQWRGFARLERHMHAVAGVCIICSGLAIELM